MGTEYDYPRPDTCVEVFIVDVDDVLLCLRRDDPCIGQWAGPGGHVNPGETLGEAAKRETHEETGLTIVRQIITGSHCESADRLVVTIMARVSDTHPIVLSDEFSAHRWCRDTGLPRPITEWRKTAVRRALAGAVMLG